MIKKIFLTMAFLVSGIVFVQAQCTPNLSCTSLVCPDTVTNLPFAMATVYYSTTMTVIVPADTTVPPFGSVTIDTIKYLSITGLPTGFTATPDKIAGWPGGTAGCLLISGTTTDSQAGIHFLVINTTIKALSGAITLPLALTGYKIIVDSSNGLSNLNLAKFKLYQNSPNPFAYKTTIGFTSPTSGVYQFSVYDVIGNLVYSQSVNAASGLNEFDFASGSLTSGIYMYKLSNNKDSYTRRMIVANK
jgi:hypothetical protein